MIRGYRDEMGIVEEMEIRTEEKSVLNDLGPAPSVWVDVSCLKNSRYVCARDRARFVVGLKKLAAKEALLLAPHLLRRHSATLVLSVVFDDYLLLFRRKIVEPLRYEGATRFRFVRNGTV